MSSVEEGDLIVRREGAAGVIRLNRPKALNAMTLEMSIGIDAALDRFETDPEVAVAAMEELIEQFSLGAIIGCTASSAKIGRAHV